MVTKLLYMIAVDVPDGTDPESVTFELNRAIEDSSAHGHAWTEIAGWRTGEAHLVPVGWVLDKMADEAHGT